MVVFKLMNRKHTNNQTTEPFYVKIM